MVVPFVAVSSCHQIYRPPMDTRFRLAFFLGVNGGYEPTFAIMLTFDGDPVPPRSQLAVFEEGCRDETFFLSSLGGL